MLLLCRFQGGLAWCVSASCPPGVLEAKVIGKEVVLMIAFQDFVAGPQCSNFGVYFTGFGKVAPVGKLFGRGRARGGWNGRVGVVKVAMWACVCGVCVYHV